MLRYAGPADCSDGAMDGERASEFRTAGEVVALPHRTAAEAAPTGAEAWWEGRGRNTGRHPGCM